MNSANLEPNRFPIPITTNAHDEIDRNFAAVMPRWRPAAHLEIQPCRRVRPNVLMTPIDDSRLGYEPLEGHPQRRHPQ